MESRSHHRPNIADILDRHLPLLWIIVLRPDAILTRSYDTLRIQSLLDFLVQLHLCMIVEGVSLGDLVHDR